MADEVDPTERFRQLKGEVEGYRHEKLTDERIAEILEVNRTLDDMVVKVVELLTSTLGVLPNAPVRLALIMKLERALQTLREDVRREG